MSATLKPRARQFSIGPQLSLCLLTAGYTISFIDRTAVSVLQDRIKVDLKLSDWDLGLLIGPAFSIIYSLASVPLARLAERGNRARILTVCITVWSIMTMACGLAFNFATLFLARMGVGIGEAGGNPASHSIIGDIFPEERRASAIAIYMLGAPLGSFVGAAGVGWLAHQFDWRGALLLLGAPGFVLALLMVLLLRDPPRRLVHSDHAALTPSLVEVARQLRSKSAFRHLVWGGALVVLVGYCVAAFLPALLLRRYHLSLPEVGLVTGLVTGVGGGLGTIIGGIAGDRWGAQNLSRLATIAGGAVIPAAVLLFGGIVSRSLDIAVAGIFLGTVALYIYIAPAFAQVHAMASSRTRATATAIYLLVTNLIGFGVGPPLVGAISDFWARRTMGLDASQFAEACLHATGKPPLACTHAMADGIEMALLIISLLPLLGGIHFFVAARRHRIGNPK